MTRSAILSFTLAAVLTSALWAGCGPGTAVVIAVLAAGSGSGDSATQIEGAPTGWSPALIALVTALVLRRRIRA